MDVEFNQSSTTEDSTIAHNIIIDHLVRNDDIYFKDQQRGEEDLNKQEKYAIALEILEKSKLNFLIRFGKYLTLDHLTYFEQYMDDEELSIVLHDLQRSHSKKLHRVEIRNRRYEALKDLIEKNSYFSEVEMMKRNPLLYDQLVGQYLTENEKRERDKINKDDLTIVKILMEGIERDQSESKKIEEAEYEDNAMEEEDSDEDDENIHDVEVKVDKGTLENASKWGEIKEESLPTISKNTYNYSSQKMVSITSEERDLLKEEFITTMYQQFLDGKDTDFDYDGVDNNAKYDNMDTLAMDEEEKYFDSEDPEDVETNAQIKAEESSEDELDMYMNALNQHPAVTELSKDLGRL